MPAVTLRQSTAQSIQKARVRSAVSARTLAVVIIRLARAGGVQPAGRHPSGGTRTSQAPNIMSRK